MIEHPAHCWMDTQFLSPPPQEDTGYEGTFGDFVGEELSGPLDAQMEQVMRENTPAEEV